MTRPALSRHLLDLRDPTPVVDPQLWRHAWPRRLVLVLDEVSLRPVAHRLGQVRWDEGRGLHGTAHPVVSTNCGLSQVGGAYHRMVVDTRRAAQYAHPCRRAGCWPDTEDRQAPLPTVPPGHTTVDGWTWCRTHRTVHTTVQDPHQPYGDPDRWCGPAVWSPLLTVEDTDD